MKTSELIGPALDWAVAKCECAEWDYTFGVAYSTDWSQGGTILEREKIELHPPRPSYPQWKAFIPEWNNGCEETCVQYGPTPLVAVMRCYVASKLGDEVEIPEEIK